MYKDFEQDIWEAALKAAVIESCMDELKDYPSDEELNKLVLPKRYNTKMHRFIRICHYRAMLITVFKTTRKIAAAVLIILGLGFGILLPFKEVRAACQNVIIQVYKKYIEFRIDSEEVMNDTTFQMSYVPEGYSLIQNSSDEWGQTIQYENASGDKIELNCYDENYTLQLDIEHFDVYDIQINNLPGEFFESQQKAHNNYLTWSTKNIYFVLSSPLSRNEMIKIANNIK